MNHSSINPGDPQDAVPIVQLRIPGPWHEPAELVAALAAGKTGWRIDTDESMLHDPTRRRVEFSAVAPDDQLADVFRGGHNGFMSDEELDRLDTHAVRANVCAPGGSADAARASVDAAAALIRAGGLGVFVDNSGACHGPDDFLKLADPREPGGLYWLFVVLTAGQGEIFSTGMHCLGLRDCRLLDPPADRNAAAFAIHNFLGYTYQSGVIITNGDPIGSPEAILFRAYQESCTHFPPDSAMHNPYGLWRLDPVMEEDEEEDAER